ncbi:hypothetical protein PQ478_02065 [Alkalihalophilus pseudofirmus]|uniref:hypothetical protein n=1 Tax=Alkalihalophilus pseudofirmus TaxID=79885 RepID=UPI00259AEB47|nr:hypothetical protein [Alkalihalophilus pseudofirmus]WEG17310.1 hypothetical protein PQ478_02065 [Alkalihalophilus pseudofirmus]
MERRDSQQGMDKLLRQLESDYIKAVKDNENTTVEGFIEQFLYDSWDYNDKNLEDIKSVLGRYSDGEIYQGTFSKSFTEMLKHLKMKLQQLDSAMEYPVLHTNNGASLLVAFVDGLVIQYYVGIYNVEKLREMTSYIKSVILHALKAEGTESAELT